MAEEIQTTKTIDIDKNDIADIAIAEAELRIKHTIRDLRTQLTKVEKDLEETTTKLRKISNDLVQAVADKKVEQLMPLFHSLNKKKPWNFSLIVEIRAVIDANTIMVNQGKTTEMQLFNAYKLFLIFKSDPRQSSDQRIVLQEEALPLFPAQIKLAEQINALQGKETNLIDDSLNWRHKLVDIPAMERQMRAAIAKRQISRTKEGKALVDQLLKSLDTDIKMLGI